THEAAGATDTRHSLRPPLRVACALPRGRTLSHQPGRTAPRDRGPALSVIRQSYDCVPGEDGTELLAFLFRCVFFTRSGIHFARKRSTMTAPAAVNLTDDEKNVRP